MDTCYRVLVAAVIAFASIQLITGQQLDIQKMYAMCQEKSNATDEELSAFQRSQSIPTTEHGKYSVLFQCLLACIFQNTGVMTKEGKYNAEGVYQLAKQSYMRSPEKLAKARQVVDICAKEVKNSEDKCEVAVIVANCTMAASTKLGLESV
ncbi:uncharacterized protein LOC124358129 [Homalodisca vitripennis]|uniref:uncharacterized protein LOC124358129 n=1 Tax=Homalodisca vitripennis TaxID=197043 RepID=UPI001EE9CF50|nr:uncharacterized protein LOC124358129 [Homalodisca vitripennis]